MSVYPPPEDVCIDELHPGVQSLFTKKQWVQRTPEWYEVRKGLMTASDAAGALGVPPFASFKGCPRMELLKKKLNNAPVQGMALEHGVKYETEAAEHAMKIIGTRMFEFGLLIHDEYPWLAASPDGITADGYAVEIKCPLRRKIIPGEVPHHYYPQIQVQMEVCNLDACYFIQYKPGFMTEGGEPFVDIVVVKRDREWFANNKEKLYSFWDELMNGRKTHIPEKIAPEVVLEINDELYDLPREEYVRELEDTDDTYYQEDEKCLITDLY
ncbi:exonuclease [Only Syngen Nebraska virus 5]|uniref:exonuclease n=1 Tax=Only Syngen Nebraska virus 5 TaxID=1917232 RepID=UPI0009008E11|nr:exonuclease [Only Syngen Nebraska virus 5]APC25583.1 ygaJ-like virus recombinase [Only Syngen Nebraska virus 5]